MLHCFCKILLKSDIICLSYKKVNRGLLFFRTQCISTQALIETSILLHKLTRRQPRRRCSNWGWKARTSEHHSSNSLAAFWNDSPGTPSCCNVNHNKLIEANCLASLCSLESHLNTEKKASIVRSKLNDHCIIVTRCIGSSLNVTLAWIESEMRMLCNWIILKPSAKL